MKTDVELMIVGLRGQMTRVLWSIGGRPNVARQLFGYNRSMPVAPIIRGPNPAKNRSLVTNRRRLLPTGDLRSAHARRFRDLCKIYGAELGGLAGLAEGDLALVKAAAGLTVESERLQCLIVEGKGVNHDAIVRLSSETRRVLERLEARRGVLQQQRQQPDAAVGLQQYLAGKAPSP